MRFSCSLYLLLTQKPLRDFGSSALIFWIFFLSFSSFLAQHFFFPLAAASLFINRVP